MVPRLSIDSLLDTMESLFIGMSVSELVACLKAINQRIKSELAGGKNPSGRIVGVSKGGISTTLEYDGGTSDLKAALIQYLRKVAPPAVLASCNILRNNNRVLVGMAPLDYGPRPPEYCGCKQPCDCVCDDQEK